MHYQFCLTMFQESLNNVMVKQGKAWRDKQNTTDKHAWLHTTLHGGTQRKAMA